MRTVTYYRKDLQTGEVEEYKTELDDDPSVRFAALAGFLSGLLILNKVDTGMYQWWAEDNILGL